MVIITENGVRYLNRKGHLVLATQGNDIPQAEYDAMSSWDRYLVLSAFAGEGDEPERTMFVDDK